MDLVKITSDLKLKRRDVGCYKLGHHIEEIVEGVKIMVSPREIHAFKRHPYATFVVKDLEIARKIARKGLEMSVNNTNLWGYSFAFHNNPIGWGSKDFFEYYVKFEFNSDLDWEATSGFINSLIKDVKRNVSMKNTL